MAKIGNNLNVSLNQFADWADQAIKSGKNGGDRMVKVWDGHQSLPKMSAGGKTKTFKERTISGAQQTGVQQSVAKKSAPKVIVSWNQSKTISKADNNTARATLLNSIRKELGLKPDTPIKDFPSGVKKAMNYGFFAKLFNYYNDWSADNGRPLSARNIKAITDAVKAEQASKAMSGLASLGKEVSAIVKGDKELQEALKNNPKGAAQLCEALRNNEGVKNVFIEYEDFRATLVQNLKDGCQNPLPIGKLSFPSTGRSNEFAAVKKDIKELFDSALENLENKKENKYDQMLHQCARDYQTKGWKIMVDGQKFNIMDGIQFTDGDVSNDSANNQQIEKNIIKLLKKLNIPNTPATRMQMMEFITQGSVNHTTLGPGQNSRFSLPNGMFRQSFNFDTEGELCTYSFTTKGDLKCNLRTKTKVQAFGMGKTQFSVKYKENESTIDTSLSVGLGIGKGSQKHPQKLIVKSVGVPPNEGTAKFNLVFNAAEY